MKKHCSLLLVFLTFGISASAQRSGKDTVLKGSTIEVTQTYKPRVKQSPKPQWKPQLPPVDTTHSSVKIEVPQQTLYYSYNSLPLRPLALGKSPLTLPYENYLKVGAGNISTAYVDAGIGSLKGEDFETGIHVHHLSQKGTIKNQQTSFSGIEAEATTHGLLGDWHATLAGSRNRYSYFGYNHALHDYSNEFVKQVYTAVKAAADLKSPEDANTKLTYHPGVYASYMTAVNNISEVTAGFDAPITYNVSKLLDLHVDLSGAFTNYIPDTTTISNNFILAAPGIKLHHKSGYSGHLLAGVALGRGGSTYFLPDMEVAFSMPEYNFRLALGWKAGLRQNTYEQLTNYNPFMMSTYQVIQTKTDEIFADVHGALGTHFSYSGRASWWNYFDLPTFLNDSGDQRQFYVSYQNVKALSFQAAARYHIAEKWSAGITGEYYSFYKSTEQFVWHAPTTRIKADVVFRPIPELDLGAYVYVLGGIHARDATYTAKTLGAIADMGINAEYSFGRRISAFVQFNNLLNSKYERWQGYQAYGFNIYGGLRLKF